MMNHHGHLFRQCHLLLNVVTKISFLSLDRWITTNRMIIVAFYPHVMFTGLHIYNRDALLKTNVLIAIYT